MKPKGFEYFGNRTSQETSSTQLLSPKSSLGAPLGRPCAFFAREQPDILVGRIPQEESAARPNVAPHFAMERPPTARIVLLSELKGYVPDPSAAKPPSMRVLGK